MQFSKVLIVPAPKSYSVCRVVNEDRDINSFEIQTIKKTENETKLGGILVLRISGSHPERG